MGYYGILRDTIYTFVTVERYYRYYGYYGYYGYLHEISLFSGWSEMLGAVDQWTLAFWPEGRTPAVSRARRLGRASGEAMDSMIHRRPSQGKAACSTSADDDEVAVSPSASSSAVAGEAASSAEVPAAIHCTRAK